MHIPDGFLSTPVWVSLDAAALPAVSYMARKAQADFTDTRIPLLGVMGAFVFAAQMVNFPVGVGTSGHLVGGALLAITLGPSAASLVMTAILTVQALVFQDGGILALGANAINMALLGVWAGYLPYHLWGQTRWRKAAIFLGGFCSVLIAAALAVLQLVCSGVRMPGPVLGLSVLLFLVAAAIEGGITVAVVGGLERMNPRYVRDLPSQRRLVPAYIGFAALMVAMFGAFFASTKPDGLESLAHAVGISSQAASLVTSPLADYELSWLATPWLRKSIGASVGVLLVYIVCATALPRLKRH